MLTAPENVFVNYYSQGSREIAQAIKTLNVFAEDIYIYILYIYVYIYICKSIKF